MTSFLTGCQSMDLSPDDGCAQINAGSPIYRNRKRIRMIKFYGNIGISIK
jgi:hypothetical protein